MSIIHKGDLIQPISHSVSVPNSNLPFYLVIIYIFLEYGRPHEIFAELSLVHLPAIVTIILFFALVFSWRPKLSNEQTKFFIFMLGLMAYHVPFALNNYRAFHTGKVMLMTFVAYLAIVIFVDSFKKFKTLINIWFAIHIYLAIVGIIKEGRGIGGFLGDENDFSMTLNMIIPFAFFMALAEKQKLRKIIYIGLAALFVLANVLTLSRGGFIGLVAVGIYCLLRTPRKIIGFIIISLITLFIIQYAPGKYWDEVHSISDQGISKGTGAQRLYEWKIGWQMFLDNPILGVGQGNFPMQFSHYEKEERFEGRSLAGRAAHSIYFTLLPELGVVGTLIFLMMLYCVFRDIQMMRKLKNWGSTAALSDRDRAKIVYLSLAMEAGLIGYLVSGIFISVLYYPNFWFLMGFVVALKNAFLQAYENHSTTY